MLVAVLLGLAISGCADDPHAVAVRDTTSGDSYFAKKSYAEATIEYRHALQAEPNYAKARLGLARAYVANDDYKNAYTEYRRAGDLLPDDIDVQAEVGNILLLGRFFDEAKGRARKILEKNPNHLPALMLLGNSLAGLRDLDSAVSVVQRAIQASPEREGSYSNLGTLELARGNRVEAEQAFRKAVELNPKSVAARLSLANFYRSIVRLDDAEAQLKAAVDIDTTHYRANLALASLYIDTSHPGRAEPYLRRVAEVRNDAQSWLDFAGYLVTQRRVEEAVQILEKVSADRKKAMGTERDDVTTRTRLALVLESAGKTGEAHKVIAEVLNRFPQDARAIAAEAHLFMVEGRIDDAASRARQAVQINPNAQDAHFELAQVYLARQQWEQAGRSLNEVLQLNPSRLDAMVARSRVHGELNELDTAIGVARNAVRVYPYSIEARVAVVRALLKRPDDRPKARDEARVLVTQYPASPQAHAALGSFYVAVNDLRAARAEFERALELDPLFHEALAQLVSVDLQSGHRADAIRRLKTRLDASPDDPAVLMMTAKLALSEKQFPEAEFMLRRLVAVDASNLEAYMLLGRLYVSEKRLSAASQVFLKVVERDPQSSTAHAMLGLVYHAQGRLNEAIDHYEKALNADPTSATANNNLAWILAENDRDLDRAQRLAETAKAQKPNDATITDTLGWVYLKREMLLRATTQLEEAVRLAPKNALLSYHLGVTYAKLGDDAKAREALQQALALDQNFPMANDAKKILARLIY